MTVENKDTKPQPPLDAPNPGQAAVLRFYSGLGQRLEETREAVANQAQQGVFVYQLQVRWPRKKSDNFMVLVKALHEDGPVIAFNNDVSWPSSILGVGSRLRAGSLEWIKDEFPPDKWVDRLAYMHKNQYYSVGG